MAANCRPSITLIVLTVISAYFQSPSFRSSSANCATVLFTSAATVSVDAAAAASACFPRSAVPYLRVRGRSLRDPGKSSAITSCSLRCSFADPGSLRRPALPLRLLRDHWYAGNCI